MIRVHARSCEDVEHLLVRQCHTTYKSGHLFQQDNDRLSREEVVLIHEHLNTCVSCTDFQSTLTAIDQTVSEGLSPISPNPDIPQRIKERMAARPPHAARSTNKLYEIATRRIPIYQAILGMAAVLVLTFVGLNASNSIDRKRDGHSTGVAFADTSGFLGQDSLQRGQTIQEDSLPIQNFRGTYDTLRTDGTLERL